MKVKVADPVSIPLPGIGTLSLTRAEYEATLIPIVIHLCRRQRQSQIIRNFIQ